jgi:hypothetical protein
MVHWSGSPLEFWGMEQDFVTTFAASLVAGAVTTAGIYTIRRFEVWARQNTTYFRPCEPFGGSRDIPLTGYFCGYR